MFKLSPLASKILKKIGGIIKDTLIISSIIIILIAFYLLAGPGKKAPHITYGVTFSQLFAEQLSLDWRSAYTAILDDLGVDKLRLVAYWPKLEPTKDNFSFADLDWQIEQASQRDAEITLAIGRRVPRWPECHTPDWAKELPEKQQQAELLDLLERIVLRYRDNKAIKYWQVENEPFLGTFGECPPLDKEFLDQEIALVERLDNRPIILTTSGELSIWMGPARRTKILGTTLYRTVWNSYTDDFFTYPIPPVFYRRRAAFIKTFFDVEKVFVVELAAEPWTNKQIYESTLEEQFKSMNVEEFRRDLDYAQNTGLNEFYFWGAEWWYWLKEKHNNDSMWEETKKLWPQETTDE